MPGRGSEFAETGPPEPVIIDKVRLLGSFGGQVMIEWSLNAIPEGWWIEAFAGAPAKRRGTPEFVMGGNGSPRICAEGTIRWSVPHADLRGAAAFVLESVVYANSRLGARRDRQGVQHREASRAVDRPGRPGQITTRIP